MAPAIGDAPAKKKVSAPTPILTADFQFDHDTPKAVQYKQDARADGKRPEVGTIYLTKEFLASVKGPNTRRLRVTIEAIG